MWQDRSEKKATRFKQGSSGILNLSFISQLPHTDSRDLKQLGRDRSGQRLKQCQLTDYQSGFESLLFLTTSCIVEPLSLFVTT